MKLQGTICALATGIALALAGCSGSAAPTSPDEADTNDQGSATNDQGSAEAGPDLSTVVGRSVERWQSVVAADWIQAFDFQDPRAKEFQPLGSYLQGKELHEYRNPSQPAMIGTEGDLVYLELAVLWEPHHPILDTIDVKP